MNKGQRILLFGGTTEGRQMAQELSRRGFSVTVCVATRTGADYLRAVPGLTILIGRKDTAQMESLMREGYACCIDATHPYAVEASASIREAALRSALPSYRLLRREMTEEERIRGIRERIRACQDAHPGSVRRKAGVAPNGSVPKLPPEEALSVRFCDSAGQACRLLLGSIDTPPQGSRNHLPGSRNHLPGGRGLLSDDTILPDPEDTEKTGTREIPEGGEGRILLTTGSKEAGSFTPLLERKRRLVYVRVLPSEESIRSCMRAGFIRENILTGRGPFSVEENVRTLQAHGIRTLVTKDGGLEGGYLDKLAASALCRASVIVIRRPVEEGFSGEEILRRLTGLKSMESFK